MSLNPMRNIYLWQQPSCASQSTSHRYVQTSGIRLRKDILTWNDLKQISTNAPSLSHTKEGFASLPLWISKLLNHLESAAQSPTRGDPTSEDWAASTDAESGMERERPKFAMVGLNLPGMLLVSGDVELLLSSQHSQQHAVTETLQRKCTGLSGPILGWGFAHRPRPLAHTFSTATHQESRLKQVQHLHAFAANLLTHTKPAVTHTQQLGALHAAVPCCRMQRGLRLRLRLPRVPLSSWLFACLLLNRSRAALCLSARAWPLLSLGAPRAFAVLRVFALFFLLPNSSTSSSSLSQAFRSLGSCRSNSPPPLPSSAALCCFSSSIALFMSGDGCLHCMQYMVPPSFLLEHSEQVQGPMLIFSPSSQSSRGLAAWNCSMERPRGVRQQPQSTRPFHAAECSGVWPQHWQRGTAAWNGRVECANSRSPRGRSMLQNAAGSDLSTGSVELQRGTAAWSAPTAAVHAATRPFHAAECSGVWPQHWQRGTAAWNGRVECANSRSPRGRSMLQNAAGSDRSTACDGGTTRGGRALLQEKFDDRRVVGPCCRKSHQRWTNWCVRLTRPLSWNYAAVCSRFNRCHKEVC